MEVSSALAEAQAHLFALRREQNIECGGTVETPPPTPLQDDNDRLAEAQGRLDGLRQSVVRKAVGWFDALKVGLGEGNRTVEAEREKNVVSREGAKAQSYEVDEVVVQPEVAVRMLRQEMAAVGRVWLLLRGMDVTGRGAVEVKVARKKLAKKEGALGVCGWRQLRNLLRDGEGMFWERRDGVIWLRSAAKVAIALGVEQVSLLPVVVPVADLCGTIGDVRSVLMATFHCGREERPIARETLRAISGVSERSQANYEAKQNIKATPQFAVLSGEWEDVAWAHGSAAFQIKDKNGRFGRPGGVVTVRQLPNCYTGTYRTASKGRKKRLNQRVAGLLNMGTAGNGYAKNQTVFAADARKGVKCGAGYFRDRDGWWCAFA